MCHGLKVSLGKPLSILGFSGLNIKFRLLLPALTVLSLVSGCGNRQENALYELKRREIPYTENDFIVQIKMGHMDTVKLFLDAGMSPDARGGLGWPAVMQASAHGHTEIAKLLLKRGAAVDATDKDGQTALIIAARHGHADIVNLLLKHGAAPNRKTEQSGSTALNWAVAEGHEDAVKALLDGGADVNLKDEEGSAPLVYAVSRRKIQIMKLLINRGADVNVEYKGKTILSLTKEAGFAEETQMLISAGAKE